MRAGGRGGAGHGGGAYAGAWSSAPLGMPPGNVGIERGGLSSCRGGLHRCRVDLAADSGQLAQSGAAGEEWGERS